MLPSVGLVDYKNEYLSLQQLLLFLLLLGYLQIPVDIHVEE